MEHQSLTQPNAPRTQSRAGGCISGCGFHRAHWDVSLENIGTGDEHRISLREIEALKPIG
jgi:hypothetical protein